MNPEEIIEEIKKRAIQEAIDYSRDKLEEITEEFKDNLKESILTTTIRLPKGVDDIDESLKDLEGKVGDRRIADSIKSTDIDLRKIGNSISHNTTIVVENGKDFRMLKLWGDKDPIKETKRNMDIE